MAGPLDYAKPAQRAALEAQLDEGRPQPPRLVSQLVELDRLKQETDASTSRLHRVPEVRQAPAIVANPTPQQEIADIMLKMTYGEFMDMKAGMEASGMQIDERKLYDWAKASTFKPA